MKAKGILLLTTVLFVCATGVIWSRCSHSKPEAERIENDLNTFLTNELSDTTDLKGMDNALKEFLTKWEIHGATLCIMRNDSLVYAKGYGEADKGVPMTPGTLLRVASVSKLLTATGIMLLQEQNRLSIDNTVFREGDVLGEYAEIIKDKRIFNITIKNLLMHESGFTSRLGDPMFSTRTLMKQYQWKSAPDHDTLVRAILKRQLAFEPGGASEYSNFGYLILSMIIEKTTGQDYEEWMQENVLKPAGCRNMHIANNFYADRYEGESRYYVQRDDPQVECYDGCGKMVARCYGGNDIRALSGAGAWVTSVPELARFVASIDGRDEVPDIIKPESVEQMTFRTDSVTFALGWNDISEEGTWTRTGTLSGTSALIKNYSDGECWILVTNTSTYRGPFFTKYISTQFRRYRESWSEKLPHRDFFYTTPSEE